MRQLTQNTLTTYGTEGQRWLDNLPRRLNAICQQYAISDLQPVNNMTFNYVATGKIASQAIVIKLGINESALAKEARCLEAFSNYGGVKPIIADSNLILMEQAQPGTALKCYFPHNDQTATKIMCELVQRLHQTPIPPNNKFSTLDSLYLALNQCSQLPSGVSLKANKLKTKMLNQSKSTVLLHGDLHHDNILSHNSSHVAIDPKGFIGEPLYDLTAFIINPIPSLLDHPTPLDLITKRIGLCAKAFNASNQDIANWSYLKAALCWAWSCQDNLDESYFRAITNLLDKLV